MALNTSRFVVISMWRFSSISQLPAVFVGATGSSALIPTQTNAVGAFVGSLSEDFHMRAGDGTHLRDVAKPFIPAKCLVGGFKPSEKYARQIGSLPQVYRGENKEYLKPPPIVSVVFLVVFLFWWVPGVGTTLYPEIPAKTFLYHCPWDPWDWYIYGTYRQIYLEVQDTKWIVTRVIYNPYKWVICPLTRVIINLHITSYLPYPEPKYHTWILCLGKISENSYRHQGSNLQQPAHLYVPKIIGDIQENCQILSTEMINFYGVFCSVHLVWFGMPEKFSSEIEFSQFVWIHFQVHRTPQKINIDIPKMAISKRSIKESPIPNHYLGYPC